MTNNLIQGLNQMLKNRGSMTGDEVQLLKNVICYLERDEKLQGIDRLQNKELVVTMLLRLLIDPKISADLAHIVSYLLHKLH